ncbi:unnamed protein product [Rhodiola kirilowii]
MHLVTWNVRGANGRKKQQAIRRLRIKHHMDLLFIQETKIRKHEERDVAVMWGGEKMEWRCVEAEGGRGGLLSIWDPEFFSISGEAQGRGFLLVQGTTQLDHRSVRVNFVNVYAPLGEKDKRKLWEDLVSLKASFEGEWIVGGDFNSVLVEEERRGSVFNKKDANLFHDFIQAMELLDFPLRGRRFTWGNKSGASRLDRFLISPGILSSCPKMEQKGLDKGPSDHIAVALVEEVKIWGAKPFRMLNVWMEQPGFKEAVREAWASLEDQGWKGYTIQRKLTRLRVRLAKWNKRSCGDIRLQLSKVREEWERLSALQDSRVLSEEEALKKSALQKRIWQLEIMDERIWRQKSRILWLKAGDQNTRYFHRMAVWRAKKNAISSILVDEAWVEDPILIKIAAQKHFASIYRKMDPCSWTLEEMNFAVLNDDHREALERVISEEEVLNALKDCDGNKAPGPDGFNMNLFKKYWSTVRSEVLGFVREFCENGRLAKGVNKTFIALIPKSNNPQRFDDFRPISLVNSVYKILAKCLAKRLSAILPMLISPNQSAFITNRNIMDGIMIINELIHAVKIEKRSALVIKVDFRKAYDTISWEYLDLVQKSMGFGPLWRAWMSECFSTAQLAVLINGSPTEEFHMERGLRQGDPLSPFLFLLAAEGLSRIINKAAGEGLIGGVDWARNGENLTHLQFADDTVLLCRAEIKEVRNLKMILEAFEGCSGLEINYEKSQCFGIGLKEEEVQRFAEELNCPVGRMPMKYLGMQVGVNPAKLSTWEPIIQRFRDKLASWRRASLSMAGRVVLIKSALCSLPLYYASMYKLPITVAREMERIQRQFLWGGTESRRKVHYVKWDVVTRPRKFGGLGIQGLVEKNMILLTKWWWKLVTGEGGLWRRMIMNKYDIAGAHDQSLVSIRRNRLSNSWKNILNIVQGNSEVAEAFREGVKLKLGRGNDILFWDDVWAGAKALKCQYPKLYLLTEQSQAKVGEMGCWVDGVWHWQLTFRRTLYQWEEEQRRELIEGLCHLKLKSQEDDRVVWAFTPDGRFTTNSLMRAAVTLRAKKKKWDHMPLKLWSGIAPPKVEMLVWRTYLDSLPTKMTLCRRRVLRREQDLQCVLCGGDQESTDHLLIQCVWSGRLWACCYRWWGERWSSPESVKILLESWEDRGRPRAANRLKKTMCYAILWSIWEERNRRCFQNQKRSVEEVVELVKARVAWWVKYRSTNCPYAISTIRRCITEVRENI